MHTRLASYALTGVIGLTGLAGAALVLPAAAYAATGDSAALDSRVTALKDALAGLVTDGTLSQTQADKVAGTLAETGPMHGPGPGGGRMGGGRGMHLAAAAEALGMTEAELRTAAEAGTTLAQLADQKDVSQETLVAALVAADKERLAAAVADGRLTQAEADERLAGAEERITDHLDDPMRARGGHRGHHGPPPAESSTTAPSSTTRSNDA